MFTQLQSLLEDNDVFDKFQSGFRSRHSTESALLKIHNDIALSVEAKRPMILVLLDLTAAFDTMRLSSSRACCFIVIYFFIVFFF